MLIQAIIAKAFVAIVDAHIFIRLAGADEGELHLALVSPSVDRFVYCGSIDASDARRSTYLEKT
jgi:hypothetical protein